MFMIIFYDGKLRIGLEFFSWLSITIRFSVGFFSFVLRLASVVFLSKVFFYIVYIINGARICL